MGRDVVHKRSRGPHSLRVVVARNFYREQFRPHVGKSTVQQASLAALFISPFLLYKLIKTLKRARQGEARRVFQARFNPVSSGCRRVKPTENPAVSFFALGEGWHNYHHSFPWDYKAAELGAYGLNPTTGFIELMARVGLAYDLKTPREELVDRTIARKGDGTSSLWGRRRC